MQRTYGDGTAGDVCAHGFRVEVSAEPYDLLDVLDLYASAEEIRYIEHPDGGEALLAVGCAHEIVTAGPTRAIVAARMAAKVLGRMVREGSDATNVAMPASIGPRFVGGFGFADETSTDARWRAFGSCRLVLPEALWLLRDGSTYCVRTVPCALARSDRSLAPPVADAVMPARTTSRELDRRNWRRRVECVLGGIEAGRVEKVVLSRSATLERPTMRDARETTPRLLRELRRTRPGCFTFCVGTGGARFVGSTPELLVRRRGDSVEAQALAGTERRGENADEDRARAGMLTRSDKNLREQMAVTRAIVEVLRPLTSELWVAPEPSLLPLPEAFHLHTPIRGRLLQCDASAAPSALELAGALHPTPAVCGTPRAVARELIEREESERGWYTGAVGWLDADGDGLFVVALRAALLEAKRATLWAGAGIVEGSDPDAEFAETEVKMRAVRAVLEDLESDEHGYEGTVGRPDGRRERSA